MGEDEESMNNNNTLMPHHPKPLFTATSPLPVLAEDTAGELDGGGGGADVAVADGEKVDEVGESAVGVSCSNDVEGAETVRMENEVVAEEGNVTVLEKDKMIEEAVNATEEVEVKSDVEIVVVASSNEHKDDTIEEAVNMTKEEEVMSGDEKVVVVSSNEQKDETIEEAVNKEEEVKSDDEKVVVVTSNEQKDETIEETVNAAKEEEVKSDDEKVVVMCRNENDEIIMAEANAVSGDMPIGANDEMEIVTRNDSVDGGAVVDANVSTVEACIGLGKDEATGAEKVIGTKNEDDDGKAVMTTNENENDETMAEAKEGDMSSDMLIGAINDAEILTRNDNIESTKDEEVEMDKMKHEDEAMGLENMTDNVEKVVVTQKEEGDEMVSRDESSAVEARIELEKDGEMEATKHEELEISPQKEEDVEMVSQVDSSAVEARLESEKDGEMEGTKHEEEEIPPRVFDNAGGGVTLEKEDEAMGAENETDKADKVAVTQNEIDDEMDTMKQDKVEPAPPDEDEGTGAEDEAANASTEETETDVPESGKASGGKRKRKNTKVTVKSKSSGRARKTIGEDVCFICFDGGDLVLCDRRGCTKAYHPSCVDRDEDFFRAKGRWNCGWHQCTTCQKNAYYMCYTCTFSLCKGCIKDNIILCVRGNKGFCKNCMRTVKLIEGLGKEEKGPIDFDDRSSFEYLFKDYFIDLKAKLSLSLKEIADAKNPWKGADVSTTKQELAETQFDNNDDGVSGSDASVEKLVASKSKRRKIKKRSKSLRKEEDATTTAATISEGFSTAGTTEWASKELLELVKHMKNGDTSVLSQFDVQALLLEYIKTNKLRDPRRKSQIICDSRLERLFGKPRVGHFEMLKLLESHFLVKEDSQIDDVQGSVVNTEVNMIEADANVDTPTRGVKDRKRKRKKGENRGAQSNLDEYAAIDVHNISLIFLRRKLVEDLLEEDDKFHDKIVGTFVRIRISGNIQKQDLYRLVQVVGTSKAAEPYKLGKRTTDIVLEILNLNKTEVLSIDTISNQDFTEEECKRLRQSIKCGLINRLTVGDILDKAMEIQTARVNDWLESEILRLSHLRDRASEKGRKKELRECVEKLQLLKTPDERHRRLEEVPEIHADPKMDPSYESEDEDSESNDVHMRSRDTSFSRRGRGPVSPGTNFSPKDSWGPAGKVSSKNWELSRSSGQNVLSRSEDGAHYGGGLNEDIWSEGRERETESKNLEKPTPAANSDPIGPNSQFLSRTESFSGASAVSSPATPQSKVAETSIKINEAEKMWHYKDPSGKIQGPFSMVQLRKWSNTGYFPADLRIWKTTDKQEESTLLTDALAGRFEKVPSAVDNILPTAVLQNRGSERTQVDQNVGSQNSPRHLVSSGGGMTSSVEVSALPTERWSNNISMNLPSPTPKQDTASWVGGDGPSVTVANLYPSGNSVHQSPPAPPDGGVRTSASINNSGGNSVRGLETNYVNSGGDFGPVPTSEQVAAAQSGYSLQNAQSYAVSEQHIGLTNSQPGAQDAALLSESLNMQNPNVSVLVPGQPQGYGNWGATSSSVQNLAGNFSNAGASALPQPDYWRAPAQGSQQHIQPTTVPTVPWGAGLQENVSSSTGWGMMPGNPNLGWNGASPAIMNVNWGATVQAMPPGNANSGWAPTGPLPGSSNSGWVAQSGNPSVQGLAPGNANPGWVAPTVGAGSTVQGAPSGNGWAMGAANPGALTQGPPQGDSNHGRGAPTGNQGTRNNDHHHDRRFSGQMDKSGSRGSNSGYNNSRNWDRQSSFGSRGPGGSSRGGGYGNRHCPYYRSGRCKKGDSCNFIHN